MNVITPGTPVAVPFREWTGSVVDSRDTNRSQFVAVQWSVRVPWATENGISWHRVYDVTDSTVRVFSVPTHTLADIASYELQMRLENRN